MDTIVEYYAMLSNFRQNHMTSIIVFGSDSPSKYSH